MQWVLLPHFGDGLVDVVIGQGVLSGTLADLLGDGVQAFHGGQFVERAHQFQPLLARPAAHLLDHLGNIMGHKFTDPRLIIFWRCAGINEIRVAS